MALTLDGMGDLILGVTADLGRGRMQNLMLTLRRYEGMSQFIKMARSEGGTHSFQKNLLLNPGESARMTTLRAPDSVTQRDGVYTITVPWRHAVNAHQYDYREMLVNMQAGENRVFDTIKTKVYQKDAAMAILLEGQVWSKPADSTDETNAWGIPMWLVKPTNGQSGHLGGNPSGFNDMAGLDATPATYDGKWSNFVKDYTSFTEIDFIEAMEDCIRETDFQSPVSMTEYTEGNGKDYSMYTNKNVVIGINRLLRSRNDNMGANLGAFGDGTATFNRIPIIHIPYLDDDTENPVYGINWSVFHFYTMKGNKFRQTKKIGEPNHNWITIFDDLSFNSCCVDRRKCFVMATV